MSKIGERLKACISLGWGEQKALALRAGVSPENFNKVLTGMTKDPGFELVARIARAAGISLDELYDEEAFPPTARASADQISRADRKKLRDMHDRLGEMHDWIETRFLEQPVKEKRAKAAGANTFDESAKPGEESGEPPAEGATVPFPPQRTLPKWSPEFPYEPKDFIHRDLDYPRDLHAREYTALPVAAGAKPATGETVKAYALNDPDVRSDTHKVSVVTGDSMEPFLYDGWKIMVDTRERNPAPGDPVVFYGSKSEGFIVGYWDPNHGKPRLLKANPNYPPVDLDDSEQWFLLGTVQKIVDAVMPKMKV